MTDRATIAKNLHVVSQPAQKGSWHWLSANEVHGARPLLEAGTTVTVNADINGVPAGNGIYGQMDRSTTFHIGASHVQGQHPDRPAARVRRRPPGADDPGHHRHARFTTRSGTKVIIEKDRFTR